MKKDTAKQYLGSSIDLDHHFSTFQIVELTDRYAKLDNRHIDLDGHLELIIQFKPKDSEDQYDHPHLREELQKVYDWYMKNCDDCKSGKEKPTIGYEFALHAPLRALLGVPNKSNVRMHCTVCNSPEEIDLTKAVNNSSQYKLENVAGDWFWQDS